MRRTILSAATLAVSALALSQALPANADGIGVSDPRDLGHGVDLRSVEVEHKAANIVVTTTHSDLRPRLRPSAMPQLLPLELRAPVPVALVPGSNTVPLPPAAECAVVELILSGAADSMGDGLDGTIESIALR